MIDIAAATVFAGNLMENEVNSARPGAPRIPHVRRPPRLRRVRLGLSAALRRAASAVAPAEAARGAPTGAPAVRPASARPAC